MRVVWDALGQVIREVLCWVLVFGHWETEASVMAPIFSLRGLGTGIVLALPRLVAEVLDLVLLVTLPLGRVTVFIKLEKPNGQL